MSAKLLQIGKDQCMLIAEHGAELIEDLRKIGILFGDSKDNLIVFFLA